MKFYTEEEYLELLDEDFGDGIRPMPKVDKTKIKEVMTKKGINPDTQAKDRRIRSNMSRMNMNSSNGVANTESDYVPESVELVNTAMTLIESGNVEAAQILLSQVLNEDSYSYYKVDLRTLPWNQRRYFDKEKARANAKKLAADKK